MDNVVIDGPLYMFGLATLDLIFKKYSGLEEGSYSIGKIRYSDSSSLYFFEFPSDYNETLAVELLNEITNKVSMYDIKDLFDELKKVN